MKKFSVLILLLVIICLGNFSFRNQSEQHGYANYYANQLRSLVEAGEGLEDLIKRTDLKHNAGLQKIRQGIATTRKSLKSVDFWVRYLEPNLYKKINGPLPVEWETEVFEKFEKPYRREGAGLTLAESYLDEEETEKDSLLNLVSLASNATLIFTHDSITRPLQSFDHFFLCNRLYLLNLAAVYTTGFECPDTSSVVPELQSMMEDVKGIYAAFNESFPATQLSPEYLRRYFQAIEFVRAQPQEFSRFDRFLFIRNFINPLFAMNQRFINSYRVHSKSYVDYTLNKNSYSIFDKGLYNGQNPMGIFLRVGDQQDLREIDRIGKLLFYDPILSGNNLRSCNSCHNSNEYFTDTSLSTPLSYNRIGFLQRNAPTLINAKFNHLVMLDGKHTSLQNQLKDVITNKQEMGSDEKAVLKKIMSCDEYKRAFLKFLKFTPQEPEITLAHVASSITYYYGKFSNYYSGFDSAMNNFIEVDAGVQRGFNLFMGKAQCGTCHFVPQFNGVKPPYVGSEFEVLGVPSTKDYGNLSADQGRHQVHAASETMNAFRTGTIRNAEKTAPYMHNGVFRSMSEVIDFYDCGGGAGHGLKVLNQTLSTDSLHLSKQEKLDLLAFVHSLNEDISFEKPPVKLPSSSNLLLKRRKVGGVY